MNRQGKLISQGFVADKAVVVANLKVQDKVVGPHAFVMDFRNESGDLVDNVTIHDMGIKVSATILIMHGFILTMSTAKRNAQPICEY